MAATWIEVTYIVPAPLADDFATFLVELSGNGVTVENRIVDTFSLDTVAETPDKQVTAYFTGDTPIGTNLGEIAAYLHARAGSCPGFTPQAPVVTRIGEEDWANGWKQHFQPTRIGTRLVLKPSWEEFVAAPDDIIVELDPGMAFGTGTHPTTRLCLQFLEQLFLHDTTAPRGGKVLDVGTGSGILAIAAAKCGAATVRGIDIDPRAVAVAAENAALNGVAGLVELSTDPVGTIPGLFDVVVANIIAEELVRLRDDLSRRVAPGGSLILSGILAEREDFVREGFAASPLVFVAGRKEEEWCCLCYRKEP